MGTERTDDDKQDEQAMLEARRSWWGAISRRGDPQYLTNAWDAFRDGFTAAISARSASGAPEWHGKLLNLWAEYTGGHLGGSEFNDMVCDLIVDNLLHAAPQAGTTAAPHGRATASQDPVRDTEPAAAAPGRDDDKPDLLELAAMWCECAAKIESSEGVAAIWRTRAKMLRDGYQPMLVKAQLSATTAMTFTKAQAANILRCRDALIQKDHEEAYHWLYTLDSKQVPHDPFKPWADLERIAGDAYVAPTDSEGKHG